MADNIGPEDAGKQVTGSMQAKQSRTRGKFGGHTEAERAERLRLGRQAASNLVRGTIQKNREKEVDAMPQPTIRIGEPIIIEEGTPLPETDLIDGKITDIGYDPADWAEFERASRVYEQRAMEDIKQANVKVDWEQYYRDEFEAAEPTFLQAAWRAIAPNAEEVLSEVVKSIPASVAGAPMDLATMSWHTLRWLGSKRDMINANDYGFIKDFPEFKSIPGTSDYIAAKYFDSDVDSMGFVFGSLLSPDPASVAKVAGVFGGPIAMARQVRAMQKTDPKRSQYLISNFEEARNMDSMGGNTEEIYKRTGWFKVGKDWRFMLDIADANMDRNTVMKSLQSEAARLSGINDELTGLPMFTKEKGGLVPVKLGDFWDHPSLYEAYPELKEFVIDVSLIPDPSGQKVGLPVIIGGDRFVVRGPNDITGAAFTPGGSISQSSIEIYGTSHANPWQRIQEQITHEVEHLVQSIEGFSRGGSPAEFANMGSVRAVRKYNAERDLYNLIEEGEIDIDDMQGIFDYVIENHGSYLQDFPTDMYEEVAEGLQRQMYAITGDQSELALWKLYGDKDVKDFSQFIKYYFGRNPDVLVEETLKELDVRMVNKMAYDIYHSLEGEGMARVAEAVWRMRKSLPKDFDPAGAFRKEIETERTIGGGIPVEEVPGGQVRIEAEEFALE